MYYSLLIFVVTHYFTQTYEDEYKHLNFEEHKDEFQMQNLTVKTGVKKKKTKMMISGGTSKKSINGMPKHTRSSGETPETPPRAQKSQMPP